MLRRACSLVLKQGLARVDRDRHDVSKNKLDCRDRASGSAQANGSEHINISYSPLLILGRTISQSIPNNGKDLSRLELRLLYPILTTNPNLCIVVRFREEPIH